VAAVGDSNLIREKYWDEQRQRWLKRALSWGFGFGRGGGDADVGFAKLAVVDGGG
jgi:hypothetical protein